MNFLIFVICNIFQDANINYNKYIIKSLYKYLNYLKKIKSISINLFAHIFFFGGGGKLFFYLLFF